MKLFKVGSYIICINKTNKTNKLQLNKNINKILRN